MSAMEEAVIKAVIPTREGMVYIPARSFRMGSERYYCEEAPAHRVTVDGFWIDATPVTNAQFKAFVEATDYKTFVEIPPDPKDYPGALPHMLRAGSLMFSPPARPVDLRDWSQWWNFQFDADWRHPYGPKSSIGKLEHHPVVHIAYCDAQAYASWAGKVLRARRSESLQLEAASKTPNSPGGTNSCPTGASWQTPGKANSRLTTLWRMDGPAPPPSDPFRPMATPPLT